jgi:hypothetical protein
VYCDILLNHCYGRAYICGIFNFMIFVKRFFWHKRINVHVICVLLVGVWLTFETLKGKGHSITYWEGTEKKERYSFSLSLALALDGGGWLMSRPVRFTPSKTCYQLCRSLGGSQSQYGWMWKISLPSWIRSPDRPVHSELLYWLRYPDTLIWNIFIYKLKWNKT